MSAPIRAPFLCRRPAVLVLLGFLSGILLGHRVPFSWSVWVPGTIAAMAVSVFRREGTALVLFSLIVCGALHFVAASALPFDHMERLPRGFLRGEAVIRGVAASVPQRRAIGRTGEKTSFSLAIRAVSRRGRTALCQGIVWVNVFRGLDLRYGDEVVLRGTLHDPFEFEGRGRSSFRDYLARQGIFRMMTLGRAGKVRILRRGQGPWFVAQALRLRTWMNGIFDRYLSPGEAGLMKAFMTGERSGIPPHVREIFQRTGTVHIIAISGLNIGMIAFGVFLVLSVFPLGRPCQMLLTMLIVGFYAFMTGAGAPVVRAAVMAGIFLFSFVIEREQDSINTLACAALFLLLADPHQAFDAAYQLSFMSVLAIIVLTPLFLRPFLVRDDQGGRVRIKWFAEPFAVSVAALVGVGGLVAYYFGMVTPVSVVANIPVVPLVGTVTALGATLILVSGVPVLAMAVAGVLKVALNVMAGVLYLFSFIPGGSLVFGTVSSGWVAGYYAVVVLGWVLLHVCVRRLPVLSRFWENGL